MITITKISDDRFKNAVNIPVPKGYSESVSDLPPMPEVNKSYFFGTLWTTKVTEILILEEGCIKFRTKNSTYQITY